MTPGASAGARVSVVVASQDAEATIVECLGALERDARAGGVDLELIVADGSRDRSRELAAAAFPAARIVSRAPGTLVPELWSAGLQVARGEIVGVTTAHCVPVEGWLPAMIAALRLGYAGVGGAIECDPRAGLVDRAVYFTRYSAYMPPFAAREVADLPGDNAAYDAAALRRFPAYVAGPFWEPFLHAEMRRAGLRLRLDPLPAVRQVRSPAPLPFLRLRFAHGWHFGAVRAREESALRCLGRALAFPLVPFVLLRRIFARTRANPAARRELLRVVPLVWLFLAAFAAGECLAALRGALRSGERAVTGAPQGS